MFKNANLYRIGQSWAMSSPDIQSELEKFAFVPCGAIQTYSSGWIPPRGIEHGALIEQQGQHQILKLCIETKAVPSNVLDKRVGELAKQFEEETGRKAGKKMRKELKERAHEELLPSAFPKTSGFYIWIDSVAQMIVVDAASGSRADDIVTALVKSLPGINIAHFVTNTDPARAMALWLTDGFASQGFGIDREVDLKSHDEFKSAASYKGCNLDTAEIRGHIAQGKVPVKLALTWMDRVSFLLTDTCQIKRIELLDIVLNERHVDSKDEAWDADVAIVTGELSRLIPEIISTLGGLAASDLFTPAPPEAAKPATKVPQGAWDEQSERAAPSDSDLLASTTGEDPLYEQAVEVVTAHNKASISLVQRHLAIGYNRAARLLEFMESAGVVSRMDASGNRTLITADA